jgi:tRNA pseudouridine38-40 synthase
MVSGNGSNGSIIPQRVALEIQYDGTGFNGWQIQNGGRTIQGELERALGILTREQVRVVASGRTDAGVHALGQIVHADLASDIDLQRVCIGLNGILDKDISIRNAFICPAGFHARFSAVQREYLYVIYNHPQRSPFMQYRALWVREPLDCEYLSVASRHLIGEKDFASFCKKRSSDGNTVRRITDIEINTLDSLIIVRIRGNAFLHNMIRIIIGTILDMYRNKLSPDHIRTVLEMRDRDVSGATVAPFGLYLNRIDYDPPLSTMQSAF